MSIKYFLDTEFIEYPCTIDLISLGIVSEDGREFYAESNEFYPETGSQWVKKYVFPQLKYDPYDEKVRFGCSKWEEEGEDGRIVNLQMMGSKGEIRNEVVRFIGDSIPEFWGYFADYDWVVFCWLFGPMISLPKSWPMYCKDIKQLADSLPEKSRFPNTKKEHNALSDAKWNRDFYNYLMGSDDK
jgi:hypothetical protein